MSSASPINEEWRRSRHTTKTHLFEHDKTAYKEEKKPDEEADDDIIFLLEKPSKTTACGGSAAPTITTILGTTTYIEWQETLRVAHILCSMRAGKLSE